jgi:hypothetical protein
LLAVWVCNRKCTSSLSILLGRKTSKIGSWLRREDNIAPSAALPVGGATSSLSPEQARAAAELAADVSRLRQLDREAEKKIVTDWMRESYWRTRNDRDYGG